MMYGPGYLTASDAADVGGSIDARIRCVMRILERLPVGHLVDFGCGDGSLLVSALRRGWRVSGVELSSEVARDLSAELGLQVYAADQLGELAGTADVLTLNDVIEHLTQPSALVRELLSVLTPGGTLIAQGPLEANANLFTSTVATVRRIRRRPLSTMPPYHVVLATAQGQAHFFRQFDLARSTFEISECAWPAPERLDLSSLRPRQVALFLLRKLSRLTGAVCPAFFGNRYLYTGEVRSLPSDP